MATSGVESTRVGFWWQQLQPHESAAGLPPGALVRFRDPAGVPTDFSITDGIVAAAAARGLPVLPVVQSAPRWAALRPAKPASPPGDLAAVERLMVALVGRYGPRGTLWQERPDLPRVPIRAWQIWNEPNLRDFWSEQPFARSYVRVLRAASRGVRRADPGATVVLAGLTKKSWLALRAIYEAGGGGLFDAVALHPYTLRPADVLRVARYARAEMRARGDRRMPVWITEFTWPAAQRKLEPGTPFDTTDRGQARKLDAVLGLLAAARRRQNIERTYWYTWLSSETGASAFQWSALRRVRRGRSVGTPALGVFRRWARRLEGCPKSADARRCA